MNKIDEQLSLDAIRHLDRYVEEVAKVANELYDLDGCCHWETVTEHMLQEHEELIKTRAELQELRKTIQNTIKIIDSL